MHYYHQHNSKIYQNFANAKYLDSGATKNTVSTVQINTTGTQNDYTKQFSKRESVVVVKFMFDLLSNLNISSSRNQYKIGTNRWYPGIILKISQSD